MSTPPQEWLRRAKISAAKKGHLSHRFRPGRPITLAPDLMWALEQLAGRDGYLDVRTWLVRQLKDLVSMRAHELPELPTA